MKMNHTCTFFARLETSTKQKQQTVINDDKGVFKDNKQKLNDGQEETKCRRRKLIVIKGVKE